jgi:single-strand DNA-binding protein
LSARNNCNFICRLATDPEVRYFENGNSVTRFRVAIVAGWGEYEEANFFDVEFWGQRGEALAERFKTGGQIGISGELTINKFDGKDGEVQKPLIKGQDWTFAGETEGKGGGNGGGGDRPQTRSQGGYNGQNRGNSDRPQQHQRGGGSQGGNRGYNNQRGGGRQGGGNGYQRGGPQRGKNLDQGNAEADAAFAGMPEDLGAWPEAR